LRAGTSDGDCCGVALILIGGRERQNLIAVARSANDRVTPAAVNKARPAFCSAAAVVAQLEIPIEAVQAAAEHARNQGVPFILNPAPATRLPASLLRLVHTLTPNEHEAELIAGVKGLSAAVRKLRQLGCLNVAVTLGARGALLASETSEHIIPGACVEPVDTVGAGDCFTAWLAVGLAEGMSLDDAAKRACHAAAISVTRPGAQASMPFRSEVPA